MRSLTLLFFLLLCTGVHAQTTLGPGDMAFTSIKLEDEIDDPSNNDEVSWVLLVDAAANTEFVYTDGEYRGAGTGLETTEAHALIRLGSAAPCGTEFRLSMERRLNQDYRLTLTATAGNPTIVQRTAPWSGLTQIGDNGILYQGGYQVAFPARYLAAVDCSGAGSFGSNATGNTQLPPGLVSGQTAIALPGDPAQNGDEYENARYNCSTTTGTSGQLAGAINTVGNWILNQSTNYTLGNGCGFTCQAACTDPVLTGLSVAPAQPCPGTTATIAINGNLNDANEWQLREGGCQGPVLATTSGNTFTVTPTATTTYAITALDCNAGTVCRTITVTTNGAVAAAGSDQFNVGGTTTTLGANTPGGSATGAWTIVSGDGSGSFANPSNPTTTFSGTAGRAYVLRWTVTNPNCNSTTTDEVEISFSAPTALVVGDLAFTGWNSVNDAGVNGNSEVSFVLLRAVNAGTTFNLTDRGWLAAGGFRDGEGTLSLTLLRNYRCGSVLRATARTTFRTAYEVLDLAGRTAADVVTQGVNPQLTTLGDQIFAYTGADNLIAGLDNSGGWDAEAVDTRTSVEPTILADNNASVSIPAGLDNTVYNCSVTAQPPVELRQTINTASRWDSRDSPAYDLSQTCELDCQDCLEPVITSVAMTPNPVCAGTPIDVAITGDLNGAARWVVYFGGCGGTEVATSSSSNFTFIPEAAGQYRVAGIGGCVSTPNCTAVSVMLQGQAAEVAQDKFVTPDGANTFVLSPPAPTGGQTSSVTEVSGDGLAGVSGPGTGNSFTITGTPGQTYVFRYTHSGGSCPETSDDFTVVFSNPTDLATGDIAFTGINSSSSGTAGFSFAALRDIDAGTRITFTDRGWDAGFLNNGETSMELVLCVPLTCGDVVYLEEGSTTAIDLWTARLVGTDEVVGDLVGLDGATTFALGSLGDQVFAYQGAEPTGESAAENAEHLLAGISTNIQGNMTTNEDWDNAIVNSSQDSDLPAQLSGFAVLIADATGTNVVEFDAGKYDCGRSGITIPDAAAINDYNNWTTTNNTAGVDLTTTCLTACCAPGTISQISASINDICPGTFVLISFTGALNDSDEWLVSSGSCDGTFVTTIGGTNGGNFVVSPTVTTTYFVRAEGVGPDGCPASECTSITITVGNAVTATCRDFVIELDADGNPGFAPTAPDGGSFSNCALDLTFSLPNNPVFDCSNIGDPPRTVTVRVTDSAGAFDECTSQVTVEDNSAPTGSCQNISVDVDLNGQVNPSGAANFFIDNVLVEFEDNCLAQQDIGTVGGTQFVFNCNDLGVNQELYGFRDNNGQELICGGVLIQINDPLNICGPGNLQANTQDLMTFRDDDGTYVLDANQLNDGSVADRGLYTLAFGDLKDRQESTPNNCTFTNTGQGQTFTAGLTGVIRAISVQSVVNTQTTLHLYLGNNGSGIANQVGTPVYSQSTELFASVDGGLTTILLDTPFPVIAGQEYSFLFEGANTLTYACPGTASYPGGRAIESYVGFPNDDAQDYTFRVDIISPTTQVFTADGVYPLDVYAVDRQGNISAARSATLTLDQALPVSWLSFGAGAGAKWVDLNWETSPEPDNAGFHVERSPDGNRWTSIAEVAASAGPDQRYAARDDAPLPGDNYYRIRQTDFDGTVTYSPVRRVVFSGQEALRLYPNPARERVTVELADGTELLGLFSVTGQQMSLPLPSTGLRTTLDLSGLPSGVYLLRARASGDRIITKRLVVSE